MNERRTSGLLISILVEIVVLLGLYLVCKYFQLPLALTATFLIFIFLALVAITEYKKLKKPQRVLLVGLILAFLLLGLLFAYDHFVNNIRISVIHVFVILFAPIAIGNYWMKKQKKNHDPSAARD